MEAAFVEEVAASLVREFLSKKVKESQFGLLTACAGSKRSRLFLAEHPVNDSSFP